MVQTEKLIYRERDYKYQTLVPYVIAVDIFDNTINVPFFSLTPNGILTINKLYAWDGASGPTIDTDNTIVPSLIHDVLYQAIRLGVLSLDYKDYADSLLYKMLIERGMDRHRAHLWYTGVHLMGKSSCEPGTDNKEIREAI